MFHRFHPTALREYDIRGIVGETLGEADAYAVGRTFGTLVKRGGGKRVAVGYDGRLSSPDLEAALVLGLTEGGVDVVRVGLGPTPMLYYAEATLGVDGGVQVILARLEDLQLEAVTLLVIAVEGGGSFAVDDLLDDGGHVDAAQRQLAALQPRIGQQVIDQLAHVLRGLADVAEEALAFAREMAAKHADGSAYPLVRTLPPRRWVG